MALSADKVREVYSVLREAWQLERPRLEFIRSYMRASRSDIYVPTEATKEYQLLVAMARFNILPLVINTKAQGLVVDGYRPTSASGLPVSDDQSPLWVHWQRNRMDARQSKIHRPALTYGTSYAVVTPGDPSPVIKPLSPWRCTALYEDDEDEWPQFAMTTPHDNTLAPGVRPNQDMARLIGPPVVRIYDDEAVYELKVDALGNPDPSSITVAGHGLGVCPVVRYMKPDDDGSVSLGKAEPLIVLQKIIDQTTFGLLMTTQYQAFRQRWATGMAIETDEAGNPLEPWNAAVNAVWQNESPDGKFGDFAEANLTQFLDSRDKTIQFAASTSQLPPHNLLIGNGISNIAAETLAALESAHQRDLEDHKHHYGESHEQVFRLIARATGVDGWEDVAAEVGWDDSTPRSLGQLVDALGKMTAQLDIPPEELWPELPNTTEQKIARWRAAKSQNALMSQLEVILNAPAPGGNPADQPVPAPVGAGVPTGGQRADTPVPSG